MSDNALADAVRSELEREPWLTTDAQIGVSAKDGAITLTGYVVSSEQEKAAVRAAQRQLIERLQRERVSGPWRVLPA